MKAEAKIQSEAFLWSYNELPETRGLLCYNHNNSRNRIEGMQNRSLGLIKGRADMTFYWKGRAYFLECKNEKGRQMPDQKKWQKTVEANGFDYYIFRSLDEFKKIIYGILQQSAQDV